MIKDILILIISYVVSILCVWIVFNRTMWFYMHKVYDYDGSFFKYLIDKYLDGKPLL